MELSMPGSPAEVTAWSRGRQAGRSCPWRREPASSYRCSAGSGSHRQPPPRAAPAATASP